MHDTPATRKRLAKESVAWGANSQYAKKLKVFSLLKNGKQTESSLKEAISKLHGDTHPPDPENKQGGGRSGNQAAAEPSTFAAAATAAPLIVVEGSAAQRKHRSPEAVHSNKVSAAIDLSGPCAAAVSKQKRSAGGSIDLTAGGVVAAHTSAKVSKKANAVVDLT